MARVGFRTIGSCAGHQVTAVQLAVLPAQRRKLGGRNFLWGGAGGFKELKRWWRYYRCPLFQAGLYLLSFLESVLFFSERGCGLWGAESLKRHRMPPPHPSSEQDLLPHAGPQPCLPPWWRVPTCPVLRAAACRTATRSADGSHTRFVCQRPTPARCPLEALLLRPAGLSSPPGPSVLELA